MQVEQLPRCVRHPKVDTAISCAECGDPICPDCMVQGPVGIKCPTCARLPRSARPHLKPEKAAAALLVSVALGLALGAGLAATEGAVIGLFAFIVAYGVGWLLGEGVKRGAGYYRGQATGVVAAFGAALAYASSIPIADYLYGISYSRAALGFTAVGGIIAAVVAYRQTS
jgi:hypothetical protein